MVKFVEKGLYMNQEIELNNELDTKIKIPKDVMEFIHTKIFKEFGIAILIFLYFIFLNLAYTKLNQEVFTNMLYCLSVILICATIIIFEVSYRKDNGEIAAYGIELLALSVVTLFMPYVYFRRSTTFMRLYSLASLFFSIYYSIKALVVYEREIRKYKDGLSDIKEITNEKNESYLNEVSQRKFENVDDSYDRSSDSVLRKRDRIKLTLERLTHPKKKEEQVKEKNIEVKKEEKIDTVDNIDSVKPKRKRGRPRKNPVTSMATEERKKKKDGESND